MDFKDKIQVELYFKLKNKLKTHSATGRALRKAAQENAGDVRHNLRFLKKSQGEEARKYILALAFMKNKKYSEVEPKSNFNKIPIQAVKSIVIRAADSKYIHSPEFERDFSNFFAENKNDIAK